MKSVLTAVKYKSVPSSQRWGDICQHFPLLFFLFCSRSVLVQDLVSQLHSWGLCWVVCMPLTFTACSSPLSDHHISVHCFMFSRVVISLRKVGCSPLPMWSSIIYLHLVREQQMRVAEVSGDSHIIRESGQGAGWLWTWAVQAATHHPKITCIKYTEEFSDI